MAMLPTERSKRWREKYPERNRANSAKWKEEFKLRDPEGFTAYNREAGRRYRFKVKAEMVSAYGGKCFCCGETTIEFLTIDHIFGGGLQHRKSLGGRAARGGIGFYFWLKKQGYPQEGYRLACFNCNCALGFLGYCPHQGRPSS